MKSIFLSKVISVTTVLLNNVRAISMYFQNKRPKFLQKRSILTLNTHLISANCSIEPIFD